MSKRQEILMETYLLFSELGYGLSLAQVTGKLGLKKQSIYNYFDSKDELILEMLDWKISEYYDGLMNVIHSTKDDLPDARLNAIMRFALAYFHDPAHLRLRRWVAISNVYDGIKGVNNLVIEYEAAYFEQIRMIIKDCMAMGLMQEDNVEDVLISFLVLVRGLIDGMFVFSKISNEDEIIEKMIEKFWKMVKNGC